MGLDPDIEFLREVLGDDKVHLEIARVRQVSMASDLSVLRCLCLVIPDNFEVIARVAWDSVGPNSGIFAPPAVDDLVLVAFTTSGESESAFIIKRLSSKVDTIHEAVREGNTVIRALEGKKLYIGSDTKTLIGKIQDMAEYTENLVLGQELKTLLTDMLTTMAALAQVGSSHTHIGNLGINTSPPVETADYLDKKSQFDQQRSSKVESEQILSDVVFTHKGDS